MAVSDVKERVKAAKMSHALHVDFLATKYDLSTADAQTYAYLRGYKTMPELFAEFVERDPANNPPATPPK